MVKKYKTAKRAEGVIPEIKVGPPKIRPFEFCLHCGKIYRCEISFCSNACHDEYFKGMKGLTIM